MNALLYKDFSDAYTVITVKENTPIEKSVALDWNNWAVIANGKIVNKNYTPKKNDTIMLRAVPHSTGNVVGDIALGFLTGFVYTIIASGVDAYKARESAKRAEEELERMKNKMRDKVTNLPYIKGATNTVATGKTEPYIIGEHLFTPYILNSGGKYQGYSVIGGENGEDQFYIVVLEGGFKKQVLRRLRSDDVTLKTWNGDTPQEGVYQFDEGVFYDAGSIIEIAQDGKPFDTPEFNKKIVQQTLNDNLRKKDDEQYEDLIYTLERYSMAADVCILFNGLVAYDDKSNRVTRNVTIIPSYSLDGGKTWTEFYFNQKGAANNTFSGHTLRQMRFNAHIDFDFNKVKNLNQPIMIKLSCNTPKYKGSAYDQCYVQWVQSTVYNPDESKTGFVPEKIIGETEAKLSTTIGLKIKSTTSNQDKLKKINVITCGTARTWNGVQWSAEKKPTRNPAAWLLEVLTSPTHTPSQCDDSEIDLASFGALYEFCKREKLTCDMVLTDGEPKENVLQKICQSCYATLYQDIYGKISVVSDSKKENAIAVLNEQNLISFSYEKDLARRTDGIKIKYISRAADYAEDTCLVMRKGAVRNSESILRDMNVTGITEYEQIVKYARYVMACDELRPKTATARVGKEGIFFTPLAKVLVQHPSLKIGLGSAQIKTVITEGVNITGLRLYEPVTLDTTHDFTVIIQCIGNDYCTPLARAIKRYNGRTKEIEFTEPIALTSPIQPHAGDILSYGYQTETVTSQMLITGIQPDDDGYTLTLVDYNEAIYDTGDIPDYTPNISQSGDGTAGTIPAQAVTPDDLANIIGGITGGTAQIGKPDKVRELTATAEKNGVRISCGTFGVGLANSIKAIMWEIKKSSGAQWQAVATTTERNAFYIFERNTDGYPEAADLQNYRVRARALNIYGILGDWSDEIPVTTTNYGTWQPTAPEITSRVSGRNVTLFLSPAPRADGREVYGAPRYQIQIKRETLNDPITGDPVAADTQFYKPATDKNYLASEDNYKDGAGFVLSDDVYMQVLPLYGQNKKDANGSPIPAPIDTPYTFAVKAINESGKESGQSIVRIIALATAARDLVNNAITNNKLAPGAVTADKIHAGTITANELYTGDLAAGGASFGRISAGGKGLHADKNNFWDLENQEFRIGNDIALENNGSDDAEYLHYKKDKGIFFKLKNFIVSSISSTILGIFRVKGKGDTDANSFLVVNPTNTKDDVTGTYGKRVKVDGTVQSKALSVKNIAIEGDTVKNYYYFNLRAFPTDTFYPIVFPLRDNYMYTVDGDIISQGFVGSAPYNRNRLNFSWLAPGWSDMYPKLTITNYGCYDRNEITILGFAEGRGIGSRAIYVRGGVDYYMRCTSQPYLKTEPFDFFIDIPHANHVIWKPIKAKNEVSYGIDWVWLAEDGEESTYVNSVRTPAARVDNLTTREAIKAEKGILIKNTGEVVVENAGWRAVLRPCSNGVELVIMGGDGGIMKKKQLWTTISGGLMSLFVLGNITSCGNIYHGNTGAITNGWTKKVSGTTEPLNGIACNGNTWGIVGYAGTILISTDNGNTFTKKASGTTEPLYGIACNGNTWIAVGSTNTILISTDNGNTFTKKASGTTQHLNGIASNGNTWGITGYAGTILISTDTALW